MGDQVSNPSKFADIVRDLHSGASKAERIITRAYRICRRFHVLSCCQPWRQLLFQVPDAGVSGDKAGSVSLMLHPTR